LKHALNSISQPFLILRLRFEILRALAIIVPVVGLVSQKRPCSSEVELNACSIACSSTTSLPVLDFDLPASRMCTLLPTALASMPFGFALLAVRIRARATVEVVITVLSGF